MRLRPRFLGRSRDLLDDLARPLVVAGERAVRLRENPDEPVIVIDHGRLDPSPRVSSA